MRKGSIANFDSRGGSTILIALIFAVVIGVLVISYSRLSIGEYIQADKTFMYNALLNLNEAGSEEAIWAISKNDWTGFTEEGGGAYKVKTVTNLNLGNGKTGTVNILVENWTTMPIIFTGASATLNDGSKISKQIRMELENRTLFANGLTAKDRLRITGGSASIDSYDSAAGGRDATTNRKDNGSIGTLSVEFENLDAGNAEVYGYVATGGGAPAFGPSAKVYGTGWAPGDPLIDPTRVTLDFTADFPDIDPPTMSPGAADDSDSDISYLTGNGAPGTRTVSGGLPGAPLEYHLTEFDMNGNRKLIIAADSHVVMRIDGDVSIGELEIKCGAQLTMYVHGDFTVHGNNYANDNVKSESFVVYGTNNDSANPSEFTLSGSAGLSAAVYAPNANLTMHGGGNGPGFSGAAVANNITLNGGVTFHYDEGLDDFFADDPSFKLKRWFELADRSDWIDYTSWTTAMADVAAFNSAHY